MSEFYVYTVGIPNTGRDYHYAVEIETNVLKRYRYAEIERMVTGTNHVTVCYEYYFNGTVDESVVVSLDDNGDIVISSTKI